MNYRTLLHTAFDRRTGLIARLPNDGCYRLFHGDREQAPGLTVDYYAGYLLIQYFTGRFYHDASAITDALLELYSNRYPVHAVLLKNRLPVSDTSSVGKERQSVLLHGGPVPETVYVVHNGIRLAADLVSAQNTGVFMDMREVRDRMVSFYPQIDSVLNLFCYTGAFSVHALAHGVPRAVNVDISAPVLDRARTNYTLNGLACDDRDFVRTDVMKAIRRFSKQGQRFGLVILDPPTFSRNKHSHFSVKKDYMRCCRLLEELTPAYVLSAMNTYSVPLSGYLSSHPQHWERIFLMHESTDFPHGNDPYLKCALWRVHDRHYG